MIQLSNIATVRGGKLTIKYDVAKYQKFLEYLKESGAKLGESNRLVKEDGDCWDIGELEDYVVKKLEKDLIFDLPFSMTDLRNAMYREKIIKERYYNLFEKKYLIEH